MVLCGGMQLPKVVNTVGFRANAFGVVGVGGADFEKLGKRCLGNAG